jgi:hypothetical protein
MLGLKMAEDKSFLHIVSVVLGNKLRSTLHIVSVVLGNKLRSTIMVFQPFTDPTIRRQVRAMTTVCARVTTCPFIYPPRMRAQDFVVLDVHGRSGANFRLRCGARAP